MKEWCGVRSLPSSTGEAPTSPTSTLVPDPAVVIELNPTSGKNRCRTASYGLMSGCASSAYSDEAGRGFRFEAGRHSEAKPATGPI